MKALTGTELEAAALVLAIEHFAGRAEATHVHARAQAARAISDRLDYLTRNLRDMERSLRKDSLITAPARREIALLMAALEVVDPGGACTQETEDDERIAREKAES
jgi:hypothetical protein